MLSLRADIHSIFCFSAIHQHVGEPESFATFSNKREIHRTAQWNRRQQPKRTQAAATQYSIHNTHLSHWAGQNNEIHCGQNKEIHHAGAFHTMVPLLQSERAGHHYQRPTMASRHEKIGTEGFITYKTKNIQIRSSAR